MPPRKKIRKAIAVIRTETVAIDDVNTHPANPRMGDVDAIKRSVKQFGQYRPVLVNEANGYILAGNHTWKAMKELGEKEILVSYVNVDDKTAAAIIAADNKLSDRGTYDDQLLAELLNMAGAELVEIAGYSSEELASFSKMLDTSSKAAIDSLENFEEEKRGGFSSEGASTTYADEDNEEEVPREKEVDKFKKADDTLAGSFDLKDDLNLDDSELVLPWGIPRLRSDMLATRKDIPDNLKAWAGSATREYTDDDQWWLYNYGIDSTSGIRDLSKVIMCFYCFDDYFEKWWYDTAALVTKCINSNIKTIVMPDYSMWNGRPRVEWLWSLYRNRWLGRYFQDAGLKLIPDITWPGEDNKFLEQHVLTGIPVGLPVISIQNQTLNEKDAESEADVEKVRDGYRLIYDTLKPDSLLLYGNQNGKKFVEDLGLGWEIIFIESRQKALGEKARNRQKKDTF